MLLRCKCNQLAIVWHGHPMECCDVAMILQCDNNVIAMQLQRYCNCSAVLLQCTDNDGSEVLQCYWTEIAMPLQRFCNGTSMLVHLYCIGVAMKWHYHLNAGATIGQLFQGYCTVIVLIMLCYRTTLAMRPQSECNDIAMLLQWRANAISCHCNATAKLLWCWRNEDAILSQCNGNAVEMLWNEFAMLLKCHRIATAMLLRYHCAAKANDLQW